jgi:hypothetical protein
MKKLIVTIIAAAMLMASCTPVILPKRGCPTNQGFVGYR